MRAFTKDFQLAEYCINEVFKFECDHNDNFIYDSKHRLKLVGRTDYTVQSRKLGFGEKKYEVRKSFYFGNITVLTQYRVLRGIWEHAVKTQKRALTSYL